MSGHEFEKQVRQKLHDLKMSPSAEAWENIEFKLKERKRRPAAFYWVPLLLMGLAAGGFFIFNNNGQIVVADREENIKTNDAVRNVADVKSTNNAQIPLNENSVIGLTLSKKKIPLEKSSLFTSARVLNRTQNEKNKSDVASGDDFIKTTTQKNNINQAIVPVITNESQEQYKAIASGGVVQIELKGNKDEDKGIRNIMPGESSANKTRNKVFAGVTAGSIKKDHQKNNRWSYGLSAMAGISAVNKGHLLNFNNAEVEDVAVVPSFAPRPPYKPSSISPGLSFSAGVFVNRDLSKTFSLSLGINYLQLNTRNKVGSQMSGSQVVNNGARGYIIVSNYFTVEQDKPSEYSNRYHFIEVPLVLNTNLNKSKKYPLHFTTGVAVSRMLKSNSLHFDGTTGVYYKNDNLVNQTQLAVKTSISVSVLNKTTRPLWIGPSAKYNLSKILQKDVSASKNFMSLGIDIKMFIR
ncbi:MAG TPA: outer membrane beta-barrel protein [Flavitalea sp.]|nr:outer membrane beta-barrel protein [Flavitalea sp.]